MALLPSDVKIDSGLTKALGDVGQGPMNTVGNVYSRLRSRAATEAGVRGQNPDSYGAGSYFNDRLATGQNQSEAALRGGLEGVLGDTGYSDFKSQRDYNQNRQLAEQIGDLMRPSLLQQVLGGLKGAAGAAGDFYGLYNSINKRSKGSRGYGTPSVSASDFGGDERYS